MFSCAVDVSDVNNFVYIESLNMAYKEVYVFKFPDQPTIQFQCELLLCDKVMGKCDGITVRSTRNLFTR